MLLVIKRTGDIQMNDLNDTAMHLKNWRTVEIQLL